VIKMVKQYGIRFDATECNYIEMWLDSLNQRNSLWDDIHTKIRDNVIDYVTDGIKTLMVKHIIQIAKIMKEK